MTLDKDNPYDEDDIRSKVLEDVRARERWMIRQGTWYVMRHDGLRRTNKPWPWAADLHFPLADMQIEKMKPFYFNQLFGTETFASFVPTDTALASVCADVGNWFDYKLKQESNLETEVLVAIDMMLMAGHDVMQIRWDTEKSQIAFDAIEPSHVIVPQWTKELEDADRVTIVKVCSREQYLRDPRFKKKDKEFVDQIQGKSTGEDGTNVWLEQLKMVREGQSYFNYDEMIVYWEIWEKCNPTDEEADSESEDGDSPKEKKPKEEKPYWKIHWLSPYSDEDLRPPMKNPFKHGKLPMVRFDMEVKDCSHYSSRGIPEHIGAFETSLSKLWNEKNDYMTLVNRPIFTDSAPIPQTGNLRMIPGQVIGQGLQAVQMPQVPGSFEEEMNYQRSVAEELVGSPDFGQGKEGHPEAPRTATEIKSIGEVMNVGVDLKSRMFRRSLGQLYNLSWPTLLQYDKGGDFLVENEMKSLTPEIISQLQENPDAFKLVPNGSGDSWNRQASLQKAIQRKQLFGNSPWIDGQELDKCILELDDPGLVRRLFKVNEHQADEYRDEAEEIPVMLLGFPMQPELTDNHAIRLKCLADFMLQRAKLGFPPDPVGMPVLQAHIQAHLQLLQKQNPKAAAAVQKSMQQAAQAQAHPLVGQPGNGAPQGAPPPGNGAKPAAQPTDAPPEKESVSINYKDAPPDIQRQMEKAAGFTPSMWGGSPPLEDHMHDGIKKAGSKPPPQPPQVPPANPLNPGNT